ncbi:MAG: DUF1615 family protein [Pseudomonadota bacterium]|nr:DUF1615 family protein [Pseudomonadota bacterium]
MNFPQAHILLLTLTLSGLTGCDKLKQATAPDVSVEQVRQLIPARVAERRAWASAVVDVMTQLEIRRHLVNTCSIIAVVDQESNFHADPVVAGLGQTAMREMNQRLEDKLGKFVAGQFQKMLHEKPTPEDNFAKRLKRVKTERQLDQLYREMFDFFESHYKLGVLTGVAGVFASKPLSEYFNPITTLGSMQVHIDYADAHKTHSSDLATLRDHLYTREGGLYYGIHRLMTYPAQYDQPLYRFADYNSGMYSSRNAAIQQAINQLDDQRLALDGDLLLYGRDKDVLSTVSSTEAAIRQLFTKYTVNVSAGQIRRDLKKEKTKKFEKTETYREIQRLYQIRFERLPDYAIMPEVVISGPKLSRDYNTAWFANRVNGRYQRCLQQGKRLGLSS